MKRIQQTNKLKSELKRSIRVTSSTRSGISTKVLLYDSKT